MYNHDTPPQRSTRPIDAPMALVGRVLDGRYKLEGVMSTGGMGIIFEATQLSVSRKIAVKLLRPTLADDADLLQRFQQEVEVVGSMSHPNVVSLIDAGQDSSGLMYLAMEFVDGETFREALHKVKLSLPEILEVFVQICDALIEAHALNIIHRDLKFDNIMLQRRRDQRLHVKVLDFGVAKILTRDVNLTRGGQIPGTPGIIAPELVAMKKPSAQSDLYSLGILLFTALAGKAPFEGQNDLELMHAHQFTPVPILEPLVQSYVPKPVIDMIYELMSKEPEERPEHAELVRDRLERIKRDLQKSFLDLPAYIPPIFEQDQELHGSGASRVMPRAAPREQPSGFIAAQPASSRHDSELQPIDDQRLMVPTSVVTMLVLVLIVLCVIVLYLLRDVILAS
jgi:serine/threonine protein kinase